MIAKTFPQVNMNGTSAEALMRQNMDVMKAARVLREALSQAAPHGRDYQTMPAGSYEKARDEWLYHARNLESLLAHFEAIAENVYEQKLEREKR